MLIIDDILFSPARGLLWTFKKIHDAAEQALENEADDMKTQLSELYMMLETGRITEEEFDAQEKELLDRLEEIENRQADDQEEEPPEENMWHEPSGNRAGSEVGDKQYA